MSEPSEIRQQLTRVLESPWFRSSSRCSQLLRHVVELAIEGEVERLKERQIAVEAFHRKPTYDNYSDPVVRVVAGDVRKRLAQYYGDPENSHQLRIELPVGSYIPVFHPPQPEPPAEIEADTQEAPLHEETPIAVAATGSEAPIRRKSYQLSLWIASACVVLIALVAFLPRRAITPAPKPSAFDEFWAPILSTEHPPLISIGELRAADLTFVPDPQRSHNSTTPFQIRMPNDFAGGMPVVGIAQSEALAEVASVLGAKKSSFDVRRQSQTTFGDILGRPVIAIGSYDNDWSVGLAVQADARFTLKSDATQNLWWISDRNNPGKQIGLIDLSKPEPTSYFAYSIVLRSTGAVSRQPRMVIGGFGDKGIIAAADFVSNPRFLNDFAQHAPRNWQKKEVEFLLMTHIVENVPGIPVIVDYSVW